MLNYNDFKMAISNFISDEFGEVMINEVKKYGESYEGLILTGQPCSPTINLNLYYQQYFDGRDLESILEEAKGLFKSNHSAFIPDMEYINKMMGDYNIAKSRLFVKLGNFEAHKDYYEDKPYHLIEDMAASYHLLVQDDGSAMITITNKVMEAFKVNEETLYKDALENMRSLLPVKIMNLDEMVGYGESPAIVITNEIRMFGAANILYPDVLERVANGEKLYILPSSIHEVITMSGEQNEEALKSIIIGANSRPDLIEDCDFLSNNLYCYEDGKIKTC
jgi:hypothetical protein